MKRWLAAFTIGAVVMVAVVVLAMAIYAGPEWFSDLVATVLALMLGVVMALLIGWTVLDVIEERRV